MNQFKTDERTGLQYELQGDYYVITREEDEKPVVGIYRHGPGRPRRLCGQAHSGKNVYLGPCRKSELTAEPFPASQANYDILCQKH